MADSTPKTPTVGSLDVRACAHCGSDFEVYREGMRFCSISCGRRAYCAQPEVKAQMRERGRKRMTQNHQDAAFRERAATRNAAIMKGFWADADQRARFERQARDRYAAGIACSSPAGDANKRAANKWIMQRCREQLIAETGYAQLYKETQERLRREMPYDGPQGNADYQDYLARLGRAVVNDPAMRALADSFMSEAIPRWGEKWKQMRREAA